MKKLVIVLLLAFVFILENIKVFAGSDKKSSAKAHPNLVSRKGFWVIEDDPKNEKKVLVFYYNNASELVRKETRPRRKVNVNKAKVMRSLKRSLEEAIEWAEPLKPITGW